MEALTQFENPEDSHPSTFDPKATDKGILDIHIDEDPSSTLFSHHYDKY